ncbi:unnamed protein product [Paramecium sonneborni]|uniref:Uncharacterized protein n=1 Tax=Paramecium sonneborni TaxID=65129 RepID=A0A8S1KAD8_9CILI|nr:unnamed protein product [Paramecium sonneborni]
MEQVQRFMEHVVYLQNFKLVYIIMTCHNRIKLSRSRKYLQMLHNNFQRSNKIAASLYKLRQKHSYADKQG